jgi:hypothetical protein
MASGQTSRSLMMEDARKLQFSARRLIVLLGLAGGAGALLQYFADPRSGRRRRHVARDRLVATFRRTIWRSGRYLRFLNGQLYGIAEWVRRLEAPDNPNPDDNTLCDRVRSELFRDWSVPKRNININVAEGVVELRGQVAHPDDIDAIEKKVRHIPGVQAIHNYLHPPHTPAPNKARVLTIG